MALALRAMLASPPRCPSHWQRLDGSGTRALLRRMRVGDYLGAASPITAEALADGVGRVGLRLLEMGVE
jgi:hypothetical protein